MFTICIIWMYCILPGQINKHYYYYYYYIIKPSKAMRVDNSCNRSDNVSMAAISSMMDSKLKLLASKIESKQATEFGKLHQTLGCLKPDIEFLKQDLASLKSELYGRIEDLEPRLSVVEANNTGSLELDSFDKMNLVLDMHKEIAEIDRRVCNIVISGIAKHYNSTDVSSDLIQVKGILTDALKLSNLEVFNMDNITASRFGRPLKPGLPRRLIVTLPSRSDVISVFSSVNKLPPGIEVRSDQSYLQQNHLKHLHTVAEAHNKVNPQDQLLVKYKRGIPALIDSTGRLRDPKNSSLLSAPKPP